MKKLVFFLMIAFSFMALPVSAAFACDHGFVDPIKPLPVFKSESIVQTHVAVDQRFVDNSPGSVSLAAIAAVDSTDTIKPMKSALAGNPQVLQYAGVMAA